MYESTHAHSYFRTIGQSIPLKVAQGMLLSVSGSGSTFILVNPRRACAARVTVYSWSVCLSVCLSTTILALQATRRLMTDTNSFSATRA